MKKLLLLFLSVALLSCGKDDPKPEDGKPKVESVTFAEVTSGGEQRVKVFLKLSIPEAGSVKSVSFLRGTTRVNNAIVSPVNGNNSFTDNGGLWPTTEAFYTFILILQDDSEITSQAYKVEQP